MSNCLILQTTDTSKEVLLWTNPSPTSSFEAQTLSLNLDSYSFIKVSINNAVVPSPLEIYTSVEQLKNGQGVCLGGNYDSGNPMRAMGRVYKYDYLNKTLSISSAWGNSTTNAAYIQPLEIYGIKGKRIPIKFPTDEYLLWTNPSPASNFSAETLDVNVSNYNYIKIIFRTETNSTNNMQKIVDVSRIPNSQVTPNDNVLISYYGSRGIAGREFWLDNDKLHFGSGWYGNLTGHNGYAIPYRIYGIGKKQ